MTAVASDRQESTFAILVRTPRSFAFAGAGLIGGAMLGAKEVARWEYLQEAAGGPWGIGVSSSIIALSTAVVGLLLGRRIDRRDPRPYVIGALLVSSSVSAVTAFLLLSGPLPLPVTWAVAAVDGAVVGMSTPAQVKTQAAIVGQAAAGSAEILNILRLGIGGVVGAVLAGRSPAPAATLWVLVGAGLVASVLMAVVLKPVRPTLVTARQAATESLVRLLRTHAPLRRIVVIDLALALAIPTQLVSLVVSSKDLPELASLAIASGMAGILLGRVLLFWRGFRDNARAVLLVTTGTVALAQVLSAVALVDDWLLRTTWAVVLVITVASVMCAYSVGFTAAVIQKGVPEDYRGRLSGVLVAGRSVLIACAALASTAIAASLGAIGILLVLFGLMVLVITLTRGFRGVTTLS